MAIYSLRVSCFSRSKGQSAAAAAAYRSGQRIRDERTGELHDYSRKGGVVHREIVAPEDAPTWAHQRERLWNAAEAAERRKNSTVAREFLLALPSELNREDRQRLAVDFARAIAQKHRCAVDVSVHKPGRGGDTRNHHAHLLCTTRRLKASGFDEKTRELDDAKTGEVDYWRREWETLANTRFKERGLDIRIDHRSLEAQGIDGSPPFIKGRSSPPLSAKGCALWSCSGASGSRQIFVQARLARAAELGRLEREHAELQKSILVLSTDIAAARAARRHQGPRRGSVEHTNEAQKAVERWKEQYGQRSSPSIEEVQRRGREAWLKLRQDSNAAREQALERERNADQGADKQKERDQERDLDLDR